MFKLSAILLLVFAVYYTKGLPSQTSKAETTSETGNNLQLYVNNGTQGVNYHLTSVFEDLKNEDQEISVVANAVLPFLNFMVGSKGSGLTGCLDELELQLVYNK